MKKNIGKTDMVIRVLAGAAILVLGLVFKTWWGLVGLLPLVTGLLGTCPLYSMLGMSTVKGANGPQNSTNVPPPQPPAV